MTVFDTSILVPLFDTSHPNHPQATAAWDQADLALLHPVVLLEVSRVLRSLARRAGQDGNKFARQAIHQLVQEPRSRLTSAADEGAAVRRYLDDRRLSLADAFVVQLALQHGEAPATFDDQLERAWRAASKKR